jgi:hypothetical protein
MGRRATAVAAAVVVAVEGTVAVVDAAVHTCLTLGQALSRC